MTMSSEKKPLQEIFPEFPLMGVWDCIRSLDWKTERGEDDPEGTGPITCSCGSRIKTGGWVGTEHAWCPDCHKGMQDMTGILPAGNASAGCVLGNESVILPEDNRHWTPSNIWGF